ncbi:MAG: T9SS type A sorting domain-containing protein, partial [Candidatus Marinimicrobia bacterium]|nr:T9SS type A sorting domain-containing protein [Candidatus Neomarinimicrobiota bacterium]
ADAPPFAKPVLDYGLLPTLSQSEKMIANYDYKTIDQFHGQILGNVLISLLTTMDSNQVDIIQAMLFPIDAVPRSWISYAGFNGISEFEGVFSDESINALRIELEDVMARVGFLIKNQFLLTSAEWENHAIKFTDRIMRRLFTVQDLLYQETDILNSYHPVLPLGSWVNTDGISFIRLGIIDIEMVQTIVLGDGQNEFILDQQTYADAEIIDVELDDSMEKIELVINGALQQILPFPQEANGYGLTIDNQFFMLADSMTAPPLIVSIPVAQFCLNEIVNRPESQQIAVEVHGNVTETHVLGLFIDDYLVWEFTPSLSFEPVFIDSAFTWNTDQLFMWLDLKEMDEFGNWQLIDKRAIFAERQITEGRIPDHQRWKTYSFSTLGAPNDLTRSGSTKLMIPEIFALYQNYPNPFNAQTTISFDLLQPAVVSLYINDAAGRIIHLFFEESQMGKGLYSYSWNGESYSSGVYFMTIQAQVDDYFPVVYSRKIIYLK